MGLGRSLNAKIDTNYHLWWARRSSRILPAILPSVVNSYNSTRDHEEKLWRKALTLLTWGNGGNRRGNVPCQRTGATVRTPDVLDHLQPRVSVHPEGQFNCSIKAWKTLTDFPKLQSRPLRLISSLPQTLFLKIYTLLALTNFETKIKPDLFFSSPVQFIVRWNHKHAQLLSHGRAVVKTHSKRLQLVQ